MRLAPTTDTVPAVVNRHLLPHELQVINVHRHPAVLVGPVGVAVAGLVAAVVSSSISAFSSAALLIIWLGWGLLLLYAIGRMLGWFGEYFVVTSQRMVLITGFLTRDLISIPNVYIASMRFRRSFMGRVLGYGQFILEADRTLPVRMINYLPYPEQLYLEVTGLVYRVQNTDQHPDD
jgi:hypothetical protein